MLKMLKHGPVIAFDESTGYAITCNGKEYRFWILEDGHWGYKGEWPLEDESLYTIFAASFWDGAKEALEDWMHKNRS